MRVNRVTFSLVPKHSLPLMAERKVQGSGDRLRVVVCHSMTS